MGFEHQLCLGACEIGSSFKCHSASRANMGPEALCACTALSRSSGVNKACGLMPATTQHRTPGPEMIKKRMARKLHGATQSARSCRSSLALIKVWLVLLTAAQHCISSVPGVWVVGTRNPLQSESSMVILVRENSSFCKILRYFRLKITLYEALPN